MGKTVTLDDDVAEKYDEKATRDGVSLDRVVNDTLRKENGDAPRKRFVVRARNLGVRPGVNFECAWKLLDELDEPQGE
ncbi:MAG TPA: hypothetical protein VKB93_18475 [Thermoanaerobaculia bacterium]|nr:hypothetical protein [Thermoanaerobaculia bacterium]